MKKKLLVFLMALSITATPISAYASTGFIGTTPKMTTNIGSIMANVRKSAAIAANSIHFNFDFNYKVK